MVWKMNIKETWNNISFEFKMYFKNFIFWYKILIEGIEIFIIYYPLKLWYMVFTPKDVEYIEDIPKLNKWNNKKIEFAEKVALSYILKGLGKK